MNFRHLATAATATTLALLTACAPMRQERREDRRDDRISTAPMPAHAHSQYAQYGQVRNIDVIPVASRTSGGGAVLGAVLGAVVGNQFGSGGGRALATGAGAIGGAVVGNNIEQRRNRGDNEVYRVSVRFDNGDVRDFDFQRIDDLRPGDRVKFEDGQLYRI